MDTAKILADVKTAEEHPMVCSSSLQGWGWRSETLTQHCRDLLAHNEALNDELQAEIRAHAAHHEHENAANGLLRITSTALLANLKFAVWCIENPGLGPTPDALANMKAAISQAETNLK